MGIEEKRGQSLGQGQRVLNRPDERMNSSTQAIQIDERAAIESAKKAADWLNQSMGDSNPYLATVSEREAGEVAAGYVDGLKKGLSTILSHESAKHASIFGKIKTDLEAAILSAHEGTTPDSFGRAAALSTVRRMTFTGLSAPINPSIVRAPGGVIESGVREAFAAVRARIPEIVSMAASDPGINDPVHGEILYDPIRNFSQAKKGQEKRS